ncbi:MAG: hypothetical protein J5819_05130 [Eubacterium sp.]|nr:hypothetical protein [Eubacterium sp.]
MADLMSGSYTYDVLKKQYENFMLPLVKLKINGSDQVEKQNLSVASLKATLSVDGASMVVIKFSGLYDEKNHTFDKKVKSTFKPGTVVEMELGYKSKSTMVFKGYVDMIGCEFGDQSPKIVVTLMDARRLMMSAGSVYRLHDVKNYSDAVKTILKKYAKLCSPKVDDTSDNLEEMVSQTQNDYDFIIGDLIRWGKVNREFFIVGDKAYFREPHKEKTPIITMQYGRELLALKTNEEYRDLKVQVFGSDEVKQEPVSGQASVTKASGQSTIISPTPELNITDPTADTAKKASDRASAIAQRLTWEAQTGRGMCIGLPELVPGRYIKVEKLDSDLCDKSYYLKTVVHEIDEEHFRTMFDIEGYK